MVECNRAMKSERQFSLKVKSKLLFQLLVQPAMHTVVRSFQVLNKDFAKSRLTLKLWRRDCSLKAGRTSFLIISPACRSQPAGRLQKPIRIPIIIRRWIGETPWLYYASSPFAPNSTAADRALSKYAENGPLWPR